MNIKYPGDKNYSYALDYLPPEHQEPLEPPEPKEQASTVRRRAKVKQKINNSALNILLFVIWLIF